MGKMQRTKGASYEREVCSAFADALGFEVKRNIGQARDGGNDIDVGPLVIECKRRKTLTTIRKWFDQAKAAAKSRNDQFWSLDSDVTTPAMPIIVCREDQGESLVVIRLTDFLILTRDELKAHVEGAV